VYALQGVVRRENRPIVHYESSVDEVFRDAALAMIKTAIRDSETRKGTDTGRVNHTGSIENVFIDAAALWMKELKGVIHLEMIEALIVLRKEMGLQRIAESFSERSRLLKDERATWSRLTYFHLRNFLSKHQIQYTGTDDSENDNPNNIILDSERSETLITQLRNHYIALIKILREIHIWKYLLNDTTVIVVCITQQICWKSMVDHGTATGSALNLQHPTSFRKHIVNKDWSDETQTLIS
jgi:hypothetical protein